VVTKEQPPAAESRAGKEKSDGKKARSQMGCAAGSGNSRKLLAAWHCRCYHRAPLLKPPGFGAI
jgi:hypothetical protein